MTDALMRNSNTGGLDVIVSLFVISTCLVSACVQEASRTIGIMLIAASFAFFLLYRYLYGTYINVKGFMTLSWVGTVGLSLLKLHPSQVAWTLTTYVCAAIVMPAFYIGCSLKRIKTNGDLKENHIEKPHITIMHLYLLALVILGAFFADCIYSRTIPLFSSSQSAYREFGMPYIHYLTVSSCLLPGLYYCYCKKTNTSPSDNGLLLLLVLACSSIPILIVSRQLLMAECAIFVFAMLVASGRERNITAIRLLFFFLVIVGMWIGLSGFRNQEAAYLANVFNLPADLTNIDTALWQMYLYTSFNLDNFNYMISRISGYSFGLQTGYPLVVFTAGKGLLPADFALSSDFRLLPTFTTYTFMAPAYRDFGLMGVAFYSLLIGLMSKSIEFRARRCNSPEWNVAYALVLYSLAITFFVSEFAQPVFWVYLFVLFLNASVERYAQMRGGVIDEYLLRYLLECSRNALLWNPCYPVKNAIQSERHHRLLLLSGRRCAL